MFQCIFSIMSCIYCLNKHLLNKLLLSLWLRSVSFFCRALHRKLLTFYSFTEKITRLPVEMTSHGFLKKKNLMDNDLLTQEFLE